MGLANRLEVCSDFPMSVFCCFHKRAENCAGWLILVHRSFRMPLHGEHEVIRRVSFQGFDDPIIGTTCDHAQTISDNIGRLVVARIHGHRGPIYFSAHNLGQLRRRIYFYIVCHGDLAPRGMIYVRLDVLN